MNDSSSDQSPLSAAPLLLIDGYNLLYATDITGQGRDAGTLQAARQALLDFLVDSLRSNLLERTVIVFDAKNPPPGLPRRVKQAGLLIHYATGFPNADELLKQYLEIHTAPRQVLVVSSDHEVQRAARRRRAGFIDSDAWYRKLLAQRNHPENPDLQLASEKPTNPPSAAEVQEWLEQFGSNPADPLSLDDSATTGQTVSGDDQAPEDVTDISNPFPPGYGEDLLSENDLDQEDGFSLD
ncbi:MAG TPA: hypothetical protein EYN70_02400 [Planctomycetaceae bacterium]|nr:hypothetical protein [Planctomycetaceae bacterium]